MVSSLQLTEGLSPPVFRGDKSSVLDSLPAFAGEMSRNETEGETKVIH